MPAESVEEQWDLPGLEKVLRDEWQLDVSLIQEMIERANSITDDEIVEAVEAAADEAFEAKVEQVGREAVHAVQRMILLQTIDRTGASTWPRSTTCARASTCAATRRRIRSRNTSARPSSCSPRCSTS